MKFLRKLVAIAILAALVAPAIYAQDATYLTNVYLERGTGRVVSQAGGGAVYNQRFRVSIANVNTGVTLLPAQAGIKYRLVDTTIIAVGGAVATCTAVTLSGTQAASGAVLQSVAVAALTQSTLVKPNTANSTVLADGASFVTNDVNTAITIAKTGASCATATNVDVILSYALES
jgi:hypothetical protein